MENKNQEEFGNQKMILKGTLWLNAKAFGLVLGLLCGIVIFLATNWLVIKGGDRVGPHLQLLGQYFIGYRVTFLGSIIGFIYGFVVGTLSGAFIGWIYNKIATFRSK